MLLGLAEEKSVRKLTVHWPSGIVQVVENPLTGRYSTIEETVPARP